MASVGVRARPGRSGILWRGAAASVLALLVTAGACSSAHTRPSADVQRLSCPNGAPSSPASGSRQASPPRQVGPESTPPPFALPSFKGLNYGSPRTADGRYLGTRWLLPASWPSARQALAADLDFIAANDLGRVLRVFIGLDQAMVWDPNEGFVRFDLGVLSNLGEALRMFQARGFRIIAVLFDQEERASPGNFRYQALDGSHPAMRQSYLRAVDRFMAWYGPGPVVAGWDLFNEPYASLGQSGLPPPPAPDPTSPNYPDSVVHSWIHDLYVHAKCAAPTAWLTFSDTTQLYWDRAADLSKFDDSVDFYDVHIYDDMPVSVPWKGLLHKPLILGEVGAAIQGRHYQDQRLDSRAVSFWLCTARMQGAAAVLAHEDVGVIFPPDRSGLTPTGYVLAAAQS